MNFAPLTSNWVSTFRKHGYYGGLQVDILPGVGYRPVNKFPQSDNPNYKVRKGLSGSIPLETRHLIGGNLPNSDDRLRRSYGRPDMEKLPWDLYTSLAKAENAIFAKNN